ncbi:MAG: UvrB/UvrC motif-containing protein [Kiritimatiellia bacterium]
MKACEICEKVEACVEVKHYEDGELRELSLCADCAQKHGLKLPASLADFLLETTLQDVAAKTPPLDAGVDPSFRCPACRMRLLDFRNSGRLGCPECYLAFGEMLEPMLMGMHRSLAYQGAVPSGISKHAGRLEQALQEAVAREDFEEAARLRDQLREVQDVAQGKQREFWFEEDQ